MKKNIILVTGGAGFIGSNLIRYLLKKTNKKIISIDNYFSGFESNHIKNKRVTYIKSSTINIENKLKIYRNKIFVAFHFGEFSRIVQSFKFIKRCIKSNLLGTYEVINFCSKNKIKLIYSASSSKFGNDGKDEHLSPYSWTKSKNIEIIKNFKKWFGLRYEIVYFYNVYGENHIKNHKMAAVIGIFEHAYEKRLPLTVVRPGNQKRDFTHVSDIVNGCYLAMKKGKNNEYLLGSGKQLTILEVAKLFESKIKFIPKRQGERVSSFYKNNLAYKHLRYKSKIKLKDYIKKFIKKF